CHRLAILDSGALVADGTPVELTAALDGRSVEVTAAQPRRAQQALVGTPGVLSVAQVGNRLRVLTDGSADVQQRMRDALAEDGVGAELEASTPNLEDVFVSATRRHAEQAA